MTGDQAKPRMHNTGMPVSLGCIGRQSSHPPHLLLLLPFVLQQVQGPDGVIRDVDLARTIFLYALPDGEPTVVSTDMHHCK